MSAKVREGKAMLAQAQEETEAKLALAQEKVVQQKLKLAQAQERLRLAEINLGEMVETLAQLGGK